MWQWLMAFVLFVPLKVSAGPFPFTATLEIQLGTLLSVDRTIEGLTTFSPFFTPASAFQFTETAPLPPADSPFTLISLRLSTTFGQPGPLTGVLAVRTSRGRSDLAVEFSVVGFFRSTVSVDVNAAGIGMAVSGRPWQTDTISVVGGTWPGTISAPTAIALGYATVITLRGYDRRTDGGLGTIQYVTPIGFGVKRLEVFHSIPSFARLTITLPEPRKALLSVAGAVALGVLALTKRLSQRPTRPPSP